MQELKLPGFIFSHIGAAALAWHVVVYLGDTVVTCKTFLYLTTRKLSLLGAFVARMTLSNIESPGLRGSPKLCGEDEGRHGVLKIL